MLCLKESIARTTRPRLIIADPTASTRATIAALVTPYFAVQEAASLQLAYHLLRAEGCELLVLGLDHPDGDGLAFLPHLREEWPKSRLCIACFSDRHDIDTKAQVFRRGADDYVVAPMQVSSIYGYRLRLLWRLCQQSRAQAQA